MSNTIISAAADAFIEKPTYTFSVPIDNPVVPKRTIADFLLRSPVEQPETVRHFVIKPCKVSNMYRVASAALSLPSEIRDGDLTESVLPLINAHGPTMVYIVAAAIQNNRDEPTSELVRFIEDNFDNIDLFNAVKYAIDGLELESFLNSIVSAKGTPSILETSPNDGSELIASHTELQEVQ